MKRTILIATVLFAAMLANGQNTARIDSMQSLRQEIANLQFKQDVFARQQGKIEYALAMHNAEFKRGITYTIIGTVLSTSAIFMYQAAQPKMTYVSLNNWSIQDKPGLKSLSYITGTVGFVTGTVGFVMMIDSDKWFKLNRRAKQHDTLLLKIF